MTSVFRRCKDHVLILWAITLLPWICKHDLPPKRWNQPPRPHVVPTHKNTTWIPNTKSSAFINILTFVFQLHCWRRQTGENYTMRSFMICIAHWILLGWSSEGGCDGLGMWHAWGRRGMCTGFWRGNMKERHHLEDVGIDDRIILKWMAWIDLAQDTSKWTW
jgi:hypothetical protein